MRSLFFLIAGAVLVWFVCWSLEAPLWVFLIAGGVWGYLWADIERVVL